MTEPAGLKLAPHLRDLPRDHRGYLVPAEAPWLDDGPALSRVEPIIRVLLAAYRACAVCGFSMPKAEPVWRIYDEGSRRTTLEQAMHNSITDNDVPGHLVCMLYSALVCPFWRTPGGRLGRDTMFTPGAKRGDQPALMSFVDYGLLLDPDLPVGTPEGTTVGLERYTGEIVFRDPLLDLLALYERERRETGGRYMERRRRHYAPVFGGRKRLTKEGMQAFAALEERGPDEWVLLDGQNRARVMAGWM